MFSFYGDLTPDQIRTMESEEILREYPDSQNQHCSIESSSGHKSTSSEAPLLTEKGEILN